MTQQIFEDGKSLNHFTDIVFGRLVQEINQKIRSGLKYEQVLDYIFDSLNLIIPYDRIGIALVENNGESARLVWVRSKGPLLGLVQNYSASLKGSSLRKILDTGEPRILNDLRLYLASHPESESTRLAIKDGILASLTCPLRANGVPIGFIFFSSFHPYTYHDQHIQTFLTIADELSIIVEYGRLKDYFSKADAREKSLSRLIHDLRAPVSTIKTCLNFASEEDWFKALPSGAMEVYSMLVKTSQEMLFLLEELVELKALKESDGVLETQKVNLLDFLSDFTEKSKTLCRNKEIRFDSSFSSNLPLEVEFDSIKVRRVLDNLISNAIKFSKRGTNINFTVEHDETRLLFSVSDQGQGVRQEELPLLFTEFGRTSTLPTEGEVSTGLGLAIAKEITEKLGGQVSVESHYGQGSTFSFWIPLQNKNHLH